VTAPLAVRELTKTFDGVTAVDRFSISLDPHTITALIGPNGAGKTTIFNLINGFLVPDKGEIEIWGMPATQRPPHWLAAQGTARTFQDLRLVRQLSVLDNVMLGFGGQSGERLLTALFGSGQQERRNRDNALSILRIVELEVKAMELAGNLSYGQQKLLTLAVALATEASILLLDEPVAGIYPETVQQIIGLIDNLKSQGKTILLIEHNLSAVADVADRVVVMDHGRKIADGKPEQVLNDPSIVEAYLA
jgi:ABC-type branched-subunit amino acid transport system ATPase component